MYSRKLISFNFILDSKYYKNHINRFRNVFLILPIFFNKQRIEIFKTLRIDNLDNCQKNEWFLFVNDNFLTKLDLSFQSKEIQIF